MQAEKALARLEYDECLVPAIWPVEVSNALVTAERRRRVDTARSVRIIELLLELNITVVSANLPSVLCEVLNLAREHRLMAYDAAYLHLAMQEGLPLATLDNGLRAAAQRVGVALLD